MDPFIITPSEALLLGRCVELYVQEHADHASGSAFFNNLGPWGENSDVAFSDRIDADIRRFYPAVASTVPRDYEVPADNITWHEADSGLKVGYSADKPRVLFLESVVGDETRIQCIEKVHSEKTFDFLLLEWLHDLLPEHSYDPLEHVAPDEWALRKFQEIRSRGDEALHPRRSGGEEPAAVEARCIELVAAPSNDHLALFKCGRLIGTLEADTQRFIVTCVKTIHDIWGANESHDAILDAWQQGVRDFQLDERHLRDLDREAAWWDGLIDAGPMLGKSWRYLTPDEWNNRTASHLRELIESGHLQFGWLSHSLLARLAEQFAQRPAGEEHMEHYLLTELLNTQQFEAALHFALGELVGHSWSADSERRKVDAQSLVPRKARLAPSATGDQIREVLDEAKAWFSSGSRTAATTVVAALSPAIEALMRRNWPTQFHSRKPDLTDILHKHRTHGSEREQKFAAIASTLLKFYRNPVAHQFEAATVSWPEAMKFYHDVRVLLELSDSIRRDPTAR